MDSRASPLHNGYSIVGLRKATNQRGEQVLWCSWPLVSHFVDMVCDLATTNIPGTKVRPNLAALQLAELNLRTRVVELLRQPPGDIPLTFDDAFKQALVEKQSLFHAVPPPAPTTALASSAAGTGLQPPHQYNRGSSGQGIKLSGSKWLGSDTKRPRYTKFDPDGNLICPDFNTSGCSASSCRHKAKRVKHCCDIWGCFKQHPRWEHYRA